jgi:hypothetical protein
LHPRRESGALTPIRPELRTALEALCSRPDDAIVLAALDGLMATSDDETYIRQLTAPFLTRGPSYQCAVIRTLGMKRARWAVPLAIKLLDDRGTRGAAIQSLELITGARQNERDADAWRAWWATNRNEFGRKR